MVQRLAKVRQCILELLLVRQHGAEVTVGVTVAGIRRGRAMQRLGCSMQARLGHADAGPRAAVFGCSATAACNCAIAASKQPSSLSASI
jgi:hypothetical protein